MVYNIVTTVLLKEGYIMDLKMLKGMKLDDLLDVDYSKLTEEEVAYVEKRLVRTANRRINQLKKTGSITRSRLSAKEKKGFTGYKAPKSRTRVTRGGKTVRINVRNKLVQSANKVRKALLKKTSRASGISESDIRYRKVISDTLGKEVKLDKRRLKRVNKLMKKAEEMYGMGKENKKLTGSPSILQTVVDIVKSREYVTNDEAERVIQEAIENGYRAGQEMMKKILDEDEDGIEFDYDF